MVESVRFWRRGKAFHGDARDFVRHRDVSYSRSNVSLWFPASRTQSGATRASNS